LLEMFLDCCSLFEVSEARGGRGETGSGAHCPHKFQKKKKL
jgi:hypothetical protein